ncbi:PepSY domain-containing protein [Zavarzinia compransoris]|uniref:PepSY domain-containing protein n=1 Tax=Zavarzinia compransoris TaxID=1264899 RepID=A0A317E155_9PROT|nr:PepSY domain-containing protein [Zavarzinia compransoris]PWR18885.1 PepSY domain-containing protein [Zavarzinia compransoris]TDP48880.1 hypothetical protein DES42_101240 [Zavarzinia compransoris]
MRHLSSLALGLATLLAAGSAFASDDLCTGTGPTKTEAEVRALYEGQGYKIRKFETDDGCYEIKGTDAAGKKVEVYINPWTGEAVKTKTYN